MTDKMDPNKFWKAIAILLKHYHTVNKKIFACKIEKVCKVLKGISTIDLNHFQIMYDNNGTLVINPSYNELELSYCQTDKLLNILNSGGNTNHCEGFIIAFKFLTKDDEDTVRAVGFIDLTNPKYACLFHSPTYDNFSVSLISGELTIQVMDSVSQEPEPNRWVEFVLKPKLVKWSNAEIKKDIFDSLHLIDLEKYNDLYKQMKRKYTDDLMRIWCESTDPLKYIYEDIAIAAYIISLWEEYHCDPKGFIDLGCGNGLLVYLLNQEGYKGCGYDVRSRKIWSKYPQPTYLFEKTVQPDNFQIPLQIDWIIGNHSDELSPWIPVMAALANSNVKFFVLPCCPYEFSGKKYQRRKSNLSTYDDFLRYIQIISKKCGFITLKDRLKIPSTKRIAFMGMTRAYPQQAYPSIRCSIKDFVKVQLQDSAIRLRESQEVVRNCTQIDSEVLTRIVKKIFEYLLGPTNNDKTTWNEGTKRTIRELAEHLSQEDLKSLKSECGGLKTLLKNKHEIFEFMPENFIKIRRPKTRDPNATQPQTLKKRLCFFLSNHPNGCPLSDEDCTFIHNQ